MLHSHGTSHAVCSKHALALGQCKVATEIDLGSPLKDWVVYLALLIAHLVGEGLQQGTLAGAGGTQQQRHAARLQDAADVVQQHELALVGLEDANHGQNVLQIK